MLARLRPKCYYRFAFSQGAAGGGGGVLQPPPYLPADRNGLVVSSSTLQDYYAKSQDPHQQQQQQRKETVSSSFHSSSPSTGRRKAASLATSISGGSRGRPSRTSMGQELQQLMVQHQAMHQSMPPSSSSSSFFSSSLSDIDEDESDQNTTSSCLTGMEMEEREERLEGDRSAHLFFSSTPPSLLPSDEESHLSSFSICSLLKEDGLFKEREWSEEISVFHQTAHHHTADANVRRRRRPLEAKERMKAREKDRRRQDKELIDLHRKPTVELRDFSRNRRDLDEERPHGPQKRHRKTPILGSTPSTQPSPSSPLSSTTWNGRQRDEDFSTSPQVSSSIASSQRDHPDYMTPAVPFLPPPTSAIPAATATPKETPAVIDSQTRGTSFTTPVGASSLETPTKEGKTEKVDQSSTNKDEKFTRASVVDRRSPEKKENHPSVLFSQKDGGGVSLHTRRQQQRRNAFDECKTEEGTGLGGGPPGASREMCEALMLELHDQNNWRFLNDGEW